MIYIKQDVYEALKDTLGALPPECGGVLGAIPGEPISRFYFDITGKNTADSYTPDYSKINEVLENDWAPQGIQMAGIVHSHRKCGNFPSCGDLYYCEQIMKNAEISEFLLPIVTQDPFILHMYAVRYDGVKIRVDREEMRII